MLSLRKLSVALLVATLVLTAPAQAQPGKYVPGDAEMVIQFNVQQILSSAMAKKYLLPQMEKAMKGNKEVQQMITMTGMDPLKDITTVTLSNAGQTGDKMMAVLDGKFNRDKIETTLKAVAFDKGDKLKIGSIAGKTVYEMDQDGKAVFAAFLDGKTMIASSNKSYIAAVLEGKSSRMNKGLQDAVNSIDNTQSMWMAAVITEEIRGMLASQEAAAAIAPNLRALTGGINITEGVAVSLAIGTSDAATAAQLKEMAEQGKGLLTFVAQSNEQAAPFVNELLKTLAIKSAKTDVSISFKMSQEIIEKAMQMIPRP